uniref:bactofilin family protein n=1 Tax=Eisenbergiella tayi TaxID=1432052 RepID=UPI003FF047A6
MVKKNEGNLKKAMNELLGIDGAEKRSEVQAGGAEEREEEAEPEREPDSPVSEEPEQRVQVPSAAGVDMASGRGTQVRAESFAMPVMDTPKMESVITSDVIIEGNVRSGSNLKILGEIVGDVACEGQITLTGNITGDVRASSLRFNSGNIQGNVTVVNDVTVEKQSHIKGDITAGSLIFNGSAEGNLMISQNMELRESSVVIGNVSADCVSMYNGARLKGLLDVGGSEK